MTRVAVWDLQGLNNSDESINVGAKRICFNAASVSLITFCMTVSWQCDQAFNHSHTSDDGAF